MLLDLRRARLQVLLTELDPWSGKINGAGGFLSQAGALVGRPDTASLPGG